MARRNLQREARHLLPLPPQRAEGIAAIRRARLGEAIVEAVIKDDTLAAGTDAARVAGIRLVFEQHVATARGLWVGGAPTIADLAVAERRTAELLGLPFEEVAAALKGHPRPATVG